MKLVVFKQGNTYKVMQYDDYSAKTVDLNKASTIAGVSSFSDARYCLLACFGPKTEIINKTGEC